MPSTILLVILILVLSGAVPRWPHSSNGRYYPRGRLGSALLVVMIFLLVGRI